jgi:hypothetical protein
MTLAFLALLAPAPARAANAPRAVLAKLDPRLARLAPDPNAAPVAVWVSFVDKGESGAADLDARLARAEAALTPRARARRLRAHVTPLVDYADLPVDPSYLDRLRGEGFEPVALSRWLNRVAYRVRPDRLADLTVPAFVARVTPVERMRRSPDPDAWNATPRATRPRRAWAFVERPRHRLRAQRREARADGRAGAARLGLHGRRRAGVRARRRISPPGAASGDADDPDPARVPSRLPRARHPRERAQQR